MTPDKYNYGYEAEIWFQGKNDEGGNAQDAHVAFKEAFPHQRVTLKHWIQTDLNEYRRVQGQNWELIVNVGVREEVMDFPAFQAKVYEILTPFLPTGMYEGIEVKCSHKTKFRLVPEAKTR